MGSDLSITKELQEYILSHGFKLHPVQKEIIDYNASLGDIKRMQISISQSQLLHLIIKISNNRKYQIDMRIAYEAIKNPTGLPIAVGIYLNELNVGNEENLVYQAK